MVKNRKILKSTSDTYINLTSDLKLFCCPNQGGKTCSWKFGIEELKSSVRQFSDGEIQVNIEGINQVETRLYPTIN